MSVAAGILPAVEGGILPPGAVPGFRTAPDLRFCSIPPGKMPGFPASRMPAATELGGLDWTDALAREPLLHNRLTFSNANWHQG
jgi:hypothetical protein